jgi:hypothetical protein
MMSGGNWWRAKDISISHLTHERDAGDRWRDKTAVAWLCEAHRDAKLTDLLQTPADCPKARSVNVYDRCKADYEGLNEP